MSALTVLHKSGQIQVLLHHVYEYRKGVRGLVLDTLNTREQDKVKEILDRKGISYFIQPVGSNKINVFFGKEECVRIVKSFGNKPLSQFTNEEDFILGIMLGYDLDRQYSRYIQRKEIKTKQKMSHVQNY